MSPSNGTSATDRLRAVPLPDPERKRLREIIDRLNRVVDDLDRLAEEEERQRKEGQRRGP